MLTIRPEQDEAFRQAALRKFEDDMVEHLKGFTPRHYDVLGEEGVRTVVRLGTERSKQYGFTNRGPVRFYIELMFGFGSAFDTDPQLPWASAVLNDAQISDQMVRADQLYYRMREYLAQVSGPDHEYAVEALHRLSEVKIEEFVRHGENLEDGILWKLQEIYPQKCHYLGEPVLRRLIRRGFELARGYSFSTPKGIVLVVSLLFAIGHGFATDPLYAWIAARLNDKRRLDPDKRAEQLYSKARIYLKYAMTDLQGARS